MFQEDGRSPGMARARTGSAIEQTSLGATRARAPQAILMHDCCSDHMYLCEPVPCVYEDLVTSNEFVPVLVVVLVQGVVEI